MECEICFEKFDKQIHKPMTIISCTHFFCLECMQKLQYQTNKCPKCKRSISKVIPCYALHNLLDLNLIVDPSQTDQQQQQETILKEQINVYITKQTNLRSLCDQQLNEQKLKLTQIKQEINQKTNDLIESILREQNDLL